MADEANPPNPNGPGEVRRDHDRHPPRHERGRHSSRHEEDLRHVVESLIVHPDSIRNPSVSGGAASPTTHSTSQERMYDAVEENC